MGWFYFKANSYVNWIQKTSELISEYKNHISDKISKVLVMIYMYIHKTITVIFNKIWIEWNFVMKS